MPDYPIFNQPSIQPFDPVQLKSEIRRRAYGRYEQRGKAHGFALDDWLRAQAEVLEEFLQAESELMAGARPRPPGIRG